MAEQAQTAADSGPRPIVPFLKLQPKPHLMGSKCGTCGSVFLDTHRLAPSASGGTRSFTPVFLDTHRLACSKCGATEGFTPVELSDKGKVYVFSVVHQSFPGIKTPYITAIVDLPEGVSVRSNIVDIDAEDAQKNPKQML